MAYIADRTLEHLRRIAEIPDLTGTRYELEGELGRGGMGVVYQVRDCELDRRAALKVMDGGSDLPADGARIIEEAKIIALLEHPGIVPLYDAGRLADGRFFYLMKLVGGVRLDDYLAQATSLPERLRVFQKMCDAIAFAHSRDVAHRDLKPQNVMVGTFGEVLVMDWGVAQRLGDGAHAQAVMIVGTPRYMAPEQAAISPESIDHRADIFSLGVMLEDVIGEYRPRPLVAIARKAKAAKPEDRYASVESLAADLVRFMDGLPVSAYHENLLDRVTRFAGNNRTLLLLLAVYVAVRFFLYFIR